MSETDARLAARLLETFDCGGHTEEERELVRLVAQRLEVKEINEALADFVRLGEHTKASRKNPNTTFVDTRDWEAALSRARAALEAVRDQP